MSLARTLLHAQRTLTRPASLLALARPSVPRLVVAQAFRPYADQTTPAVAAAADVEATPPPAVEAEDQLTPPAAAAETSAESAVESRVFVRKLPAGATKEAILSWCSSFNPTSVDLPLTLDGQPKGFGFITFPSSQLATEAINHLSVPLPDRAVEASFAKPKRSDPQTDRRQSNPQSPEKRIQRTIDHPPCERLFIGNLEGISNEALDAAVRPAVIDRTYSLHRGYSRETGDIHGFAFLNLASVEEAKEVRRAMRDLLIDGTRITVNFPRSQEAKERRKSRAGKDRRE